MYLFQTIKEQPVDRQAQVALSRQETINAAQDVKTAEQNRLAAEQRAKPAAARLADRDLQLPQRPGARR